MKEGCYRVCFSFFFPEENSSKGTVCVERGGWERGDEKAQIQNLFSIARTGDNINEEEEIKKVRNLSI